MNLKKHLTTKNITGLVAVILFAAIASYMFRQKESKLHEHGKYKVATVIDYERVQGTRLLEFRYSFDGQDYTAASPMRKKKQIGDKVFIIFLPWEPTFTRVFYDIPVPDSLATFTGTWQELPVPYDQADYDMEFE
ncbi:hypothetical protein [Gilvibacter sp.]|uniref:hypothetical protein n=1 Tax=Gilvibacter sp. TaxID=2729997 RepID=UPI003F49E20D